MVNNKMLVDVVWITCYMLDDRRLVNAGQQIFDTIGVNHIYNATFVLLALFTLRLLVLLTRSLLTEMLQDDTSNQNNVS